MALNTHACYVTLPCCAISYLNSTRTNSYPTNLSRLRSIDACILRAARPNTAVHGRFFKHRSPLEQSSPLTVFNHFDSLKTNRRPHAKRRLRAPWAPESRIFPLLSDASAIAFRQNTPMLHPFAASQQNSQLRNKTAASQQNAAFCSLISATPRWGGAQPRILRGSSSLPGLKLPSKT